MSDLSQNIPPHWKTAKLEELINLVIGGDWGKHGDYPDKDFVQVHCIRASEIKNWQVEKGKTAAIRKIAKTSLEKRKLIEGDILVEISGGGPEQPVGRAVLIDKEVLAFRPEIPKVCTNFFRLIRLNSDFSPIFITQYLQFFYKAGKTADFQAGSNNLRNLKFKDYVTIPIPLPPLPEQHLIVAKIEELFSELDNAVENLKKAKEQIKVYRQAVLKWAFEGKLTEEWRKERESQNSEYQSEKEEVRMAAEEKSYYSLDIGLPKKWKKLKLKEIAWEKDGLRRGPFGSAIKKEFFVNAGYKVYEQGNAINDDPYRGSYFINLEKYNELKNFSVLPNDLIVSCSGVTLGKITEIPIDAQKGIINQALLRIRLRSEIISNTYFIQYFRSAMFQKKIFSQSQGSAMPNLVGIKDFKEIELLVPPFDEQGIIVQEIDTRFSVSDKLEQSIDQSLQQAEALRQSILKRAFEGRLI